MSYHVTVLRSRNGTQLPIPRAEAEAAIAARPELRTKPNDEGGLEITVVSRGDESPVLVWQDGEIWTGNPDDVTLQLMLELAQALGARVRGDELETYRTVHETYRHPDDAADEEVGRRAVKRMRRTNGILRFFPFVLAAVVLACALCVKYLARRGS